MSKCRRLNAPALKVKLNTAARLVLPSATGVATVLSATERRCFAWNKSVAETLSAL